MAVEDCYEDFRKSPLAAELTDEESALVSQHLACRRLKDGEILFREGDVDNSLYVIADGNLAVAHETPEGEWVVLHMLRPGDLAGELGFLDGLKHTATLRSIGQTELISLEREHLEELIDTHPRVVYQVMRAVIRTVHGTLRRMNIQYVEMSNYINKQHGRY
ncbi:MAG: cyclic nucleotide-binding domain-containing protein [Thiobacillaceae bacterium]|jgi:CRP/FNR family cyclic AMP-dependent transcriptional regulator